MEPNWVEVFGWSESRTENGTTIDSAFAYDPLGQLTGFTHSVGISEQYSYDEVENMTRYEKDRTYYELVRSVVSACIGVS